MLVWGKTEEILLHWEKICLLPSCPTFSSFHPLGFCGRGQTGLLLFCWFWVTFYQPGVQTETANTPPQIDQRLKPPKALRERWCPARTRVKIIYLVKRDDCSSVQGESWEASGWFTCSFRCIQIGLHWPFRATSESSTLPGLALVTRPLGQGPYSHACAKVIFIPRLHWVLNAVW